MNYIYQENVYMNFGNRMDDRNGYTDFNMQSLTMDWSFVIVTPPSVLNLINSINIFELNYVIRI